MGEVSDDYELQKNEIFADDWSDAVKRAQDGQKILFTPVAFLRLTERLRELKQRMADAEEEIGDRGMTVTDLEEKRDELLKALKAARTNVAYAHQPDNCGDHCRNNCRDCVLRNTLEDIDAAIKVSEEREG